jgi:outer membrane autotransporter protein
VINPTTYEILVSLSQQSYVTASGGASALTGNQYAVAADLDTFSTSGQASDLITALNTLSSSQLPVAFDTLSGVEHTFAPYLAFQASRQVLGLLGQRLDAGRDGGQAAQNAFGGIKLAYGGSDIASLLDGQKTEMDGFWLQGLGSSGRIDGDGGATGVKHSGGGLALGADRRLTENLLAGLAVAYNRSGADTNTGGLDVDSYQLAAYGRWQGETVYLDAMLGLGRHRLDSHRSVTSLGKQARANYDGDSVVASLEAGRPLARGKATLTPYAGLLGMTVRHAGFTESGGGGANLAVGGNTRDSLRSILGVRYAWTGETFAPALDLAWVHEFGDARSRVDAGFAAAPGAAGFQVSGPELDRDRLALGLGLTAWQAGASRIDVGYRGEFANSDRSHALAATYRKVW